MIKEHLKLLGTRRRDRVTGVIGIVTSISFDLYGCILAIMQEERNEKGEVPESKWYDVKRLVPHDNERVMDIPDYDAIPVGSEAGPADKPSKMP
jgi:hypothetical protein